MISGFSAPDQSLVLTAACKQESNPSKIKTSISYLITGLSLVPCSAAVFLCEPEVFVLTDSFIYQQEMKLQQPFCSGRAPILFPKPILTRKTSNPISHHQHQRLGINNNQDKHSNQRRERELAKHDKMIASNIKQYKSKILFQHTLSCS